MKWKAYDTYITNSEKRGTFMTFIQPHTKAYRKASLALFISGFVTFATLYTTQPLMPLFSEEFHISAAAASLTLSISTAVLAFSLLAAASLSDGFGRKISGAVVNSYFCFRSINSVQSGFSGAFGDEGAARYFPGRRSGCRYDICRRGVWSEGPREHDGLVYQRHKHRGNERQAVNGASDRCIRLAAGACHHRHSFYCIKLFVLAFSSGSAPFISAAWGRKSGM